MTSHIMYHYYNLIVFISHNIIIPFTPSALEPRIRPTIISSMNGRNTTNLNRTANGNPLININDNQ